MCMYTLRRCTAAREHHQSRQGCWRLTCFKATTKSGVEGKELEYKDEYIVVQWLELLEGGNGREYFLSDERECIWELTALMPVKKLGRYPIPSDMQNAHRPRKPYELAALSKNALDALA